jgi:Putative NADPH-quinone reductase (modulator of drug activity B)
MKVLIIYAHPNPQSFNHSILESFTKGLAEAGHAYEVVDLYAIKFNPCLSGEDFGMFMQGKVSDDVRDQQEKVSQANGLVFIHPVWWIGLPAMLKGWFDRVFSMGFAYGYDEKTGDFQGLLKNKKALIINTAAAKEEEAKTIGWADILKKIEGDFMLKFNGIDNVQQVIFYNVNMTDDATRKGFLEKARDLGKTF